MKVIIYTRPDNGISVVNPAPNYIAKLMADGMTEVEAVDVVRAKDVPANAVDVEIIEVAAIPTDRWFRNAWTRAVGGGPIKIDMPKAREIQANKIQRARRDEIDRLRSEEDTARFVGRATNANQHAANRTTLETMNFPAVAASIASAANPTALRAIWPIGLPGRPV